MGNNEFNKNKYDSEYKKKNYKEYKILARPELSQEIEIYCQKNEISRNQLFLEAVKSYIGYMGK